MSYMRVRRGQDTGSISQFGEASEPTSAGDNRHKGETDMSAATHKAVCIPVFGGMASLLVLTLVSLAGCISSPCIYSMATYNDVVHLLDAGWQVNASDDYGYTLVRKVASWSNPEEATRALALLLSKGADVNSKDR